MINSMRQIALLVAALLMSCSGDPAPLPTEVDNSFPTFFSAFRTAALEGDEDSVVKMTRFPFELKGVLDEDGTQKLASGDFRKLLPKLLAQDSGRRPAPEAMRILLEQTQSVERFDAGAGEIMIGTFTFEQNDGRWRFVRAYVDE